MFYRTALVALLAVSLLTLAIFAVPQSLHSSGHGATCLATAVNGGPAPCPERDPLGFLNFHFNAFKDFSRVQTGLALSLVFFVLLFFVALAVTPVLKTVFLPLGFFNNFALSFLVPDFNHWLKFHENSPNFS